MIDCHCHLADDEFDTDLDQVIQRAQDSGVQKMIIVAEFSSQFQKILDICEKYQGICYPALGLHPVQQGNRSVTSEDLEGAESFLVSHHDMICAVGELGLDFTPRYIKSDNDKAVQREVFRKQIELAKEWGLPVNVHSRSSGRPVIDLLIQSKAKDVLLHAFSGNVKSALAGIKEGYYFSIPPSFANKPNEKKPLIDAIPLDQICLETDSPVLGPSNTERNEPKNLSVSARFIAEIKGISVEEVIAATTKNAIRLFKKIGPMI